jgi:alpha-1,2-mannosyltransferase
VSIVLRSASRAAADAPRSGPQIWGARAKWLSWLVWAIAAIACLLLSVYVISKASVYGSDSWFPMGRALAFLHSPHNGLIYQVLFVSGHIKFQYPLTSLLPLDLLNGLGIIKAAQLNAINAIVLIVLGIMFAVFSAKILGPLYFLGIRLPIMPFAFLAALLYFPNYLALILGQIQILLDLLFLLSCLAMLYKRRLLAGSLIGASALVKPQFILLGLLALWRRNWRFAVGFGVIGIVCLLLSAALYGYRNEFDYLPVLTFLSHHGEWEHMNQSVNGLMVRFLYHGPSLDIDPDGPILQSSLPPYIPAVYYATVASSLVMMAIPFVMSSKPDDVLSKLLHFCTAAILFTMASPIAWTHHYGVLLPAYVVAFKVILDRMGMRRAGATPAPWVSLVGLGISFLLTGLALGPTVGPTIPDLNLLQSHVFFGACILVAALVVEHRFRGRTAD